MAKQQNTSLVPVAKQLPATRPAKTSRNHFRSMMASDISPSREDVREFLPDILGKALARTWIDADFRTAFDNDPCGTLESHGVFLPENMLIEFQRQNADRPRIVVYEQRPNSKFKARVLYLAVGDDGRAVMVRSAPIKRVFPVFLCFCLSFGHACQRQRPTNPDGKQGLSKKR